MCWVHFLSIQVKKHSLLIAAGVDFHTLRQTLEFERFIDVNITIINDELMESNETFLIFLSSDAGVKLSPYAHTEVIIINDDDAQTEVKNDDTGIVDCFIMDNPNSLIYMNIGRGSPSFHRLPSDFSAVVARNCVSLPLIPQLWERPTIVYHSLLSCGSPLVPPLGSPFLDFPSQSHISFGNP